jgi:hypothetical protein
VRDRRSSTAPPGSGGLAEHRRMTGLRRLPLAALATLVAAAPLLAGIAGFARLPRGDHFLLAEAALVVAAVVAAACVGGELALRACPGAARAQCWTTAALVGLGTLAAYALLVVLASDPICAHYGRLAQTLPWLALAPSAPAYLAVGTWALGRPARLPLAWPLALLLGVAAALIAVALHAPAGCYAAYDE